MTQTSDDSSKSGCSNSSTSSSVIMNHDTGEKGTSSSPAEEVQERGESEEGKGKLPAPILVLPDKELDADAQPACISRGSTGSAAADDVNSAVSSKSFEKSEMNITSNTSSSFSKAPMCAICSEPCICYCKSCKTVSYCSKEHQKKHWKQHRPECYPVTVQVNSVFGSHLVVTRDVRRGEVILREKPLVVGASFLPGYENKFPGCLPETQSALLTPNLEGANPSAVCLSCYKILSDSGTPSSCSKCGWPICCSECEKNPTHADQECKVFAEYHLEPSAICDKDAQYLCVALVRILLHKRRDPTKWSQFMDVVCKQGAMKDGLNSLIEAKKSTAHFSDLISKSLGSIIHAEFSLTDAEIDQIVRTLRTTAFVTDSDENYINGCGSNNNLGRIISRTTTHNRFKGKTVSVYHLASMLTSNCIPNASWVIQESLEFYLRASVPIKTGERITITYVDPLLGTWDRRKQLWKEKYLSCSCSRCADPTELATFFSAIKCPGKGKDGKEETSSVISECEGYLLLQDPLAVTFTSCYGEKAGEEGNDDLPGEKLCEERVAEWKCNVCLMRQPWDCVRNLLQRMRLSSSQEEEDDDVCFTNNGATTTTTKESSNMPEADSRKRRDEHEPKIYTDLQVLHAQINRVENVIKNHVHMNHYQVLKMENELLTTISKLLERGQIPFDEMEKWATKIVDLCKKGLKVVNILSPGLSRPRGRLLYFLQQGLTICLLFKTSRAMRIVNHEDSCTESSSTKEVSHEELAKKFQELILARKEILEIFAIERETSVEKSMLRTVQQDSVEIRVLKNHFKYHQNVSTCLNPSSLKSI